MKFGALDYLWLFLIIPALIFFYLWAFKRKKYLIEQFVSNHLKDRLLSALSPFKQKVKVFFIILVFIFSILALIRPKWGLHWEEVARKGVDIIIALDVSKSMLATDVSPNRLKRAKREILDLLNILQGDRVGLVAFAGVGFLQSPLTLDYGAVQIFLDDLDTDLIPVPGTAIAHAIETSIKSFDQENEKSRVLILITDGEDHQGDPVAAAKKAQERGIRIYTIGIGQEGGAPIPDSEKGGFKKNRKGEMILTQLDEETLQKVALASSGSYVRSVSGDLDLEKIYQDIQQNVQDKELKSGKRKFYEERFQWPLFLALLFLVFEVFLTERKKLVLLVFLLGGGLFNQKAYASWFESKEEKAAKNYQDGQLDLALQGFIDAQIERPHDYELKYNLGNTYYKMKNYPEAQKLFESVAMYGKRELAEKAYYNLGNVAYRMGKLKESVEYYQRALEINPDNEDTKANIEFVRDEIRRRIEENKKRQEEQQNQQEQQKKDQQDQDQKDQDQKDQDQKDQDQKDQGQKDQDQTEKKEQEGQKEQDKKDDQQEEGQEEDKNSQDNQKENEDENTKGPEKEEKLNPEDKKEGSSQASNSQKEGQEDEKDKENMEEALRWLSTLDEDRKDIIKRKLKGNKSYQVEKDW